MSIRLAVAVSCHLATVPVSAQETQEQRVAAAHEERLAAPWLHDEDLHWHTDIDHAMAEAEASESLIFAFFCLLHSGANEKQRLAQVEEEDDFFGSSVFRKYAKDYVLLLDIVNPPGRLSRSGDEPSTRDRLGARSTPRGLALLTSGGVLVGWLDDLGDEKLSSRHLKELAKRAKKQIDLERKAVQDPKAEAELLAIRLQRGILDFDQAAARGRELLLGSDEVRRVSGKVRAMLAEGLIIAEVRVAWDREKRRGFWQPWVMSQDPAAEQAMVKAGEHFLNDYYADGLKPEVIDQRTLWPLFPYYCCMMQYAWHKRDARLLKKLGKAAANDSMACREIIEEAVDRLR